MFTKQWNANKRSEVIGKEETTTNSEVFVQQDSGNDENSQLASTIMLGGIQQACSLEQREYRFHGMDCIMEPMCYYYIILYNKEAMKHNQCLYTGTCNLIFGSPAGDSYKKLPRRHTSPSIRKFTYNTLYPCLTGNATMRLQHSYNDVSGSVRLPSVTMTRPMSKTMFHAIHNKSDIVSTGNIPPIKLFTKFAVVGHQLVCPDSNPPLENVSSNEKAPLAFGNRIKIEHKNGTRIMKSPGASNKQKKV